MLRAFSLRSTLFYICTNDWTQFEPLPHYGIACTLDFEVLAILLNDSFSWEDHLEITLTAIFLTQLYND